MRLGEIKSCAVGGGGGGCTSQHDCTRKYPVRHTSFFSSLLHTRPPTATATVTRNTRFREPGSPHDYPALAAASVRARPCGRGLRPGEEDRKQSQRALVERHDGGPGRIVVSGFESTVSGFT